LHRLRFDLRFQESGIARRRRPGKVSSTAPIGLGASTITVAEDAPAQGHSISERAFTKHNSSTNCPISHRPRPQGSSRGAVWDAQEPTQDGVGDGLADGQHHVADNLARDGGRQLLQAGWHGTPQPGKAGRRAGNRDFQLSPAALLHLAITQTGVLYQSP
jgi:hypothetical protein